MMITTASPFSWLTVSICRAGRMESRNMKTYEAIPLILATLSFAACGAEAPTPEAGDQWEEPAALSTAVGQSRVMPILNFTHVSALAAGALHMCALIQVGFTEGVVRCWGENATGKLGYGNTKDIGVNETPASAG